MGEFFIDYLMLLPFFSFLLELSFCFLSFFFLSPELELDEEEEDD